MPGPSWPNIHYTISIWLAFRRLFVNSSAFCKLSGPAVMSGLLVQNSHQQVNEAAWLHALAQINCRPWGGCQVGSHAL